MAWPRRPKPSRLDSGGIGFSDVPPTPWLSATTRRSIPTNRPLSGRLVQSALAVVWTSTSQPPPRRSAVTIGVPSASRAQVFLPRRSEEHTSELQSLMRISYAVFCLQHKKRSHYSCNCLLLAHLAHRDTI